MNKTPKPDFVINLGRFRKNPGGNLTEARISELEDLIPKKMKAQKTADMSGQTEAARLMRGLDEGIGDYLARKPNITDRLLLEDILAIKNAARALLNQIRCSDELARNLIDIYAYGSFSRNEFERCSSTASRYGINWQRAMEEDGLGDEAAAISAKFPDLKKPDGSILSCLWDLATDVELAADAADASDWMAPPNRNTRTDRTRAALFAYDVVRHCTWALDRSPSRSEWFCELVSRAGGYFGVRVGKAVTLGAIERWAPENKPPRLPITPNRAA